MSAQFSENGFGRPSNYHVNKKRCWPGFMGTSWCVYVYLFIYFDGPGLCLQKMGNPKRTVDGSAKTFHLGENDIVSSTSRERKGVSRGTCLNSVMSKPHIYVGVRPNSAKRWPSRDERALKFAAIIINASSRKKRAVKKSKRFFFLPTMVKIRNRTAFYHPRELRGGAAAAAASPARRVSSPVA